MTDLPEECELSAAQRASVDWTKYSRAVACEGLMYADNKTVVIVVNYGPSLLSFRGALIEKLADAGHNVIVVAPDISDEMERQLYLRGGKGIRLLPISRTGLNPIGDLRTFIAIRRILLEVHADVLITYTIKPAIWGALAARSLGIKGVIPVINGAGYAFSGGRGIKRMVTRLVATFLYRAALGGAHIVLFQNPDDMALFRELGILSGATSSAVVNGSGIDIVDFNVRPFPSVPSFLMTARFLREKGVREFGEAARLLRLRYPDVPIRLAGFIYPSPDSITQIELDEIVASGVEYLGQLEDVRPAIAESSVYVLPSYYREGTPRSTLEAMAMGRAVVTTDAPGCRETVIEGVNGYLVPPRDAVALAAAMERFIVEPSLAARMGAESRRIVEERYDVHLVNAEIMRHAGLLDPAT